MAKTKRIRSLLVNLSVLAGLTGMLTVIQPLIAQSSAFSYHGFLTDQGRPANGIYDLHFTIYDSVSDGTTMTEPVGASDLIVSNGTFNITLDFGTTVFDGGDRWLEIAVRPGGSGGEFVNVLPRQMIGATPYAIRAANYSGPVDVSQITGNIAVSSIADGSITADKLAGGAVVANLTAEGQESLVLDGGGLTNLNASALSSGTIPVERFPAVLPAIDGSLLTGINGGNGIHSFFGQGTNTDLLNPSYRGILSSTNAYPVVRATAASSSSSQMLMEGYTGDTNGAPWSFRVSHSTNNFNPTVNDPSPFSAINDVQYHYGYNLNMSAGYDAKLPWWVRGHEMGWFNPYRPPQMEFYDRVGLTNGALSGHDVGFGYTLHLETGRVEANINADSLAFQHPWSSGQAWMLASANTNNEGVMTFASGYLDWTTASTNEWMLSRAGTGVIGARGGNYLFAGGTGDDKMTLFKGANATGGGGSVMTMSWGSTNPRGLRWNVTRFEYQTADGIWRAFNDEVSLLQKSYTIPANTQIGELAGDYRTLGTCKADENYTHSVQIDLCFNGGDDQTCQRYVVPISYGAFHADWQELLPLHESGRNNVKHFAVDTRFVTSWREFRVRRINATGVGVGSFTGIVTTYLGTWTNDVSGFGSGATVTQIEASTPLIQTAGKVGINTNNPQAALDVGNAGNVFASGFLVRSNGWTAIPTLQEGDVWLGSSNGILHSVSLVDGTYTTNRMVP